MRRFPITRPSDPASSHVPSRATFTLAVALLATLSATAHASPGRSAPSAAPSAHALLDVRFSVPSRALLEALERVRTVVPSFSRQTRLACSMCHHQFPQLTPFGRLFKLNGYTMTGIPTIAGDDTARPSLKLSGIPPLSAMLVASLTHTGKAQPAAQNNSTMFPEQASLFLAGALTPRVGAFVQFTYAAQDGTFGVDNIDVRYSSHTTVMAKDLLFGVTMHNNPTVQDVFNTVPAWSYPFMSSSVALAPAAGTLIEGALGQQVLGLGAYGLWDNTVYLELTGYRSAQQGTHAPLDSSSSNVTRGVTPYARVALQHDFPRAFVMVGGFGFLGARQYPHGVTGPTNDYTTLGVDAQMEHKVGNADAMVIGRTSFIHERQTLNATFAAGESQAPRATLESFKANVSLQPNDFMALSVGVFSTHGTTDTLLFAPAELTGSRTGSPNSDGMIGELTVNPWLNTRLSLQYVAYGKFNGARDAYDEANGRRARDNNTLYLYTWVAF